MMNSEFATTRPLPGALGDFRIKFCSAVVGLDQGDISPRSVVGLMVAVRHSPKQNRSTVSFQERA
jgi:hypothetical protein